MRAVVFIALLHLSDCKEESKPRSVNLALETVLEFNNEDNSADLHIIDKVKSFLDRIKFVIDKNKSARRSFNGKEINFTDFVKNAVRILSKYSDNDLEDVIAVVDDEIRKYHYKGCKFYELIENNNVRRFMAGKLDDLKNTPAKTIRSTLNKISNTIEEDAFNEKQKKLIDYVNSLYREESTPKFQTVLSNLNLYKAKSKRANIYLVKLVRDGLRSIFFDHYSNMDYKTRNNLKIRLETFWHDYSNPLAVEHHVWTIKPLHFDKTHKVNKMDTESSFSSEPEETSPTTTERLITKKSKLRHNKHMKKVNKENDRYTKYYTDDSQISVDKPEDEDIDKILRPSKKKKKTYSSKGLKKHKRTTKQLRMQTLWEEQIVTKGRSRKLHDLKKVLAKKEEKKRREEKEMKKLMAEQQEMKELVAKEREMTTATKKTKKKKMKHLAKSVKERDESPNVDTEDFIKKILEKQAEMKKIVRFQSVTKKDNIEKPVSVKTEMEKMMDEHEKMKKNVKINHDSGVKDVSSIKYESNIKPPKGEPVGKDILFAENVAEINVIKKQFASLARKRDMETTAKMLLRNRYPLNRASKHRKPDKSKTDELTNTEEFISQEHNQQASTKNSRKFFTIDYDTDSNEGIPIGSYELPKKSFRKYNVNDSMNTPSKYDTFTTVNVIKRISDLEKELKNVKAQIGDTPELVQGPVYDKLDFWEGTTKAVLGTNATTPATDTTKLDTTTTKPTTTTRTTTIKLTVKIKPTTHKTTVKVINSTYHPVFRSKNNPTNETHKINDKDKKFKEMIPERKALNKMTTKKLIDEKARNHTSENNIDIYHESVNIDDFNDIGTGLDTLGNNNMNLTSHLESLQKYLNDSKVDPNDTKHVVRKKMYEEPKGILNEDADNTTAKALFDKDPVVGKDILKAADPLEFLDDGDDLI